MSRLQFEEYQAVRSQLAEAREELEKVIKELDEARALPKKVWILIKNDITILGVFDEKNKALFERDSWVVPFTDESYEVREHTVR